MKALEDFMYKGKHVKGGDEVAIDAKDVPKLRGLGKIPVPQDSPEPVKKKKDHNNIRGISPDIIIEDDIEKNPKSGKRKRRY